MYCAFKQFEFAINCIIAYGVVIDFATKLKDTTKEKVHNMLRV